MRRGTRALAVGAVGLGAAYGCFALSEAFEGLIGASLFIMAILLVPVALGVAIGSHHADASGWMPAIGSVDRPSGCRQCRGERQMRGQVWVCRKCDVIPV